MLVSPRHFLKVDNRNGERHRDTESHAGGGGQHASPRKLLCRHTHTHSVAEPSKKKNILKWHDKPRTKKRKGEKSATSVGQAVYVCRDECVMGTKKSRAIDKTK